jgi:hypothetical protein
MLLVRGLAGQGVACETTAAAVGYVILDQSLGVSRPGTGATAVIGTTGAIFTLSAADVANAGAIAIFAVDVGGNAVGQVNADVGAPIPTGATQYVAAICPAAGAYSVIKSDGSSSVGAGAIGGVGGALGASYTQLQAAETNLNGPVSVLFTAAGAVVGVVNDQIAAPVPPVVTQTVTIRDDAGNLLYTGLPLSGMTQAQLKALILATDTIGAVNILAQDSGLPPPPARIARLINDQRGF